MNRKCNIFLCAMNIAERRLFGAIYLICNGYLFTISVQDAKKSVLI